MKTAVIEEKKTWYEFYEKRINSTYQSYFEERYRPFLSLITSIKPDGIVEEGIGIGSVSKALLRLLPHKSKLCGFDIDRHMIALAKQNLNNKISIYQDDILSPKVDNYYNEEYDLAVTHGVIEHFSNKEIQSIFERYKKSRVNNIHYVPLDKYRKPSFGDERLLSVEQWLELVKPNDFMTFNDGHDLILINV